MRIGETPLRVLHVAPERGLGRRIRRLSNIEYLAVDLDGRQGAMRLDVTDLPFRSEFDLVLCSHVLEHIPDDRRALAEIWRVLDVGGVAILQHPIDRNRAETFEDFAITSPEERERVFFQFDHVRIYGRDIEDRFSEAGFRFERVPYIAQVSRAERQLFLLEQEAGNLPARNLEADVVYVCHKDAP